VSVPADSDQGTQHWAKALVGRRVAARHAGLALGAVLVLVLEIIAVILSGWLGPILPLGLLGLALFAVLCWTSLPVAWFVVLVCTPFSIQWIIPSLRTGTWVPTEPFILTFLGVWIVKATLRGTHTIPRSQVLTSIVLLVLIAILSTLQSEFPFTSFKALVNTCWYLGFAFLFPYLEGMKNGFLRRAHLILAGSAVFFALYGILFIIENGVARWTGNAMGRPFFPEHGTYSVYLCFGLAVLLGFALSAKRGLWRLLGFLGVAAVTLAIVLSLTRAAFLGLAAVGAVFLWYLLQSRRGARSLLLVLAAVVLVTYGVSKFRAGEFVGLYVSTISNPGELSNVERIGRWMAAINMVRDRPFLGVGFGTYQDAYFQYRVLTMRTEERFKYMGPHSEYFAVLSEMGWIGFAALLWFFFVVTRMADRVIRRSPDPNERMLALSALAALSSYMLHGAFNNYMRTDKLMVPFWFLVATIPILAARMPASKAAAAKPAE
jgi:O-antigen ligase